eukprot:1601041-Alexandrium_andersonii.AAC.1
MEVGDPAVLALSAGGTALHTRLRCPHPQLEGFLTSADSKPVATTFRPVGLLGPQPLPYGLTPPARFSQR